MEINNAVAQNSPKFEGVKVSKKAMKAMISRGELPAFKEVLPELQRRGEKANIRISGHPFVFDNTTLMKYVCNIKPKNTLFDNPITRALGLSKSKSGFSYYGIHEGKMKKNDFEELYNEAYKDKRYMMNRARKIKLDA